MRVLLLAGTAEGRELADRLAPEAGIDLIVSLAGRTTEAAPYPGEVITGGFGGADGLAAFLADRRIDLLIDATHPFATTISANAADAARRAGISAFRLARPAWREAESDTWQRVGSLDEAASALGPDRRTVFLAVGRQSVAPFLTRPQHRYIIRSVEPVEGIDRFADATNVLARGPFTLEAELELFRSHRVEILVAKDSGGEATAAKLQAARDLGISVILVDRPEAVGLPTVEGVEEALVRLAAIRMSAEC